MTQTPGQKSVFSRRVPWLGRPSSLASGVQESGESRERQACYVSPGGRVEGWTWTGADRIVANVASV